MTNLHQSVTVEDLYEMFGLRPTNYLRKNCHIEVDHFSNVDQPFTSATANFHLNNQTTICNLHYKPYQFSGLCIATEMQ